MKNLIKKELYFALSSYSIYIVVILFLLCNSLLIWVFNNDSNILNNNLASLESFFNISPLILMIFIPAITMNLFNSETESGNIEVLLTKPFSHSLIIISKYLSSIIISLFMITPTIVYVVILNNISVNNIDLAEITSSYVGLFFILIAFNAIGVLVSVISKSQITSLFTAILLCWLFYFGIDLIIENINSQEANLILSFFSIKTHYISLKNGIIFLSDIIYFVSFSFTFIIITIKFLTLYEKN